MVTTKQEYVLSTKELDVGSISPSDHEEADTRLLLHLKHAILRGHEKAYIRTVDSDVIVISVTVFNELKELGLTELWIGMGTRLFSCLLRL